ncbi:hypothetical protein E3T28_03595 [Cryobacterium sinapicolor]|uniref:Asparagine synthase n=1 Tax=Cryobacterium sinapicolor TaxID=1259236 RepID=A0ABY2JIE0_9MICO|nr:MULTISPECIES: hypothetical protein [Cryobacterium]TFC84437.1 hypothetical protein E3O67_13325 [Cryobacterium sp. TMT3-29-2]TFD03911.1 hypothetical protein E3T28_03595 [Cryobacterium sinapicolor]
MASFERIVDEGLLIALSAVRMAVKNHIIVGALREHRDFAGADYTAATRSELTRQATHNEEDAERVGRQRKAVGRQRSAFDITDDDRLEVRQLALRRRVHLKLAGALRAVARDDEQVADLLERARTDASEEIGAALANRLVEQVVDSREPDYAQRRAERMRALVSTDLAALLESRRSRSRG